MVPSKPCNHWNMDTIHPVILQMLSMCKWMKNGYLKFHFYALIFCAWHPASRSLHEELKCQYCATPMHYIFIKCLLQLHANFHIKNLASYSFVFVLPSAIRILEISLDSIHDSQLQISTETTCSDGSRTTSVCGWIAIESPLRPSKAFA